MPILHEDLTANLDMKTYKIEITDNYSIQTCNATGDDRLGSDACFVYLYPNFMINRCNTITPILRPVLILFVRQLAKIKLLKVKKNLLFFLQVWTMDRYKPGPSCRP